ncbi:CotH kinase family protein [Bacteriovoracaceae bacterium]|nr:CotH kinase family protein [Bacteriovoracaceae bacterium]
MQCNPNLKTFFYLVVIFVTGTLPYFFPKLNKAQKTFNEQSEKSGDIYNGKIGLVYNPLDEAFVITENLKLLKEKEKLQNNYAKYKGWKVISAWLDPIDLYDNNRGLLTNATKRGRVWERAAYLYYYDNNKLILETYTGARIHGGFSRLKKGTKNFRFYFRKPLGEYSFNPPGLNLSVLKNKQTPIKRLVIHKDQRRIFQANLAFSLVELLDGYTSKAEPVLFLLNGKVYGHFYLAEHLSRDQFVHELGHDDFYFYNLKGDNDLDAALMIEKLLIWIKYSPSPINLSELKKRIDLDSFTKSIMALMYAGTMDWNQGVMFFDKRGDQRWKWITWDMDLSFQKERSWQKKVEHPWEIESVGVIADHYKSALRSRIFRRLVKESPEYRNFFKREFVSFLDNKLTPEWIDQKFSYYEELAKSSDDPSLFSHLKELREFFYHRPEVIKRHLEHYLED